MNECQGTTLNDSAGNSLTGTYSGTASVGTCSTSGAWFNGVAGKRNYSLDFDGQIDDFRIYSYELTSAQVKTLMNDGATRFGPNTGAP